MYRYFWLEGYDPLKCKATLGTARRLDDIYESWQPSGCMMHTYREGDIFTCLKDRRIVFIGDSTVRQIFRAVARRMNSEEYEEEGERHTNHYLNLQDVLVEFHWDPYLNTSSLLRELTVASLPANNFGNRDTTAILLIGGGLWHARYLEDDYLLQFQGTFREMAQVVDFQDEILSEQRYHGSLQKNSNTDTLIVFAPVPIPAYKQLSHQRAETLTHKKIESMNSYLQQASTDLQIPVAWSFSAMVTDHARVYQSDGIHVNDIAASAMADVLLNTKCNAVLRKSQSKAYPMDKTCCNPYEPPSWIQAMILYLSTGLLPLIIFVQSHSLKKHFNLPSREIARAVTVLGLAVSYCYYADRTHLFNKAQKEYHYAVFGSLLMIASVLGALTIRHSPAPGQMTVGRQVSQQRDQPFLSRHQTDEWKGWMQIIILIYHYTGASRVLWIYQIIRLLVASYLFMTGFGHTVFFCKRADYSLRRSAAVLIRLNMLSCVLPYVMRTEYLFYYFSPLISFWYVVIYCTMATGRNKNNSSLFLIFKIVVSAICINLWIRIPVLFETLFDLLRKTCHIEWDVVEWRFRLQLDSFIVYIGMLCAILFVRITEILRSPMAPNHGLTSLVQRNFDNARIALGTFAILMLPSFFFIAQKASTKKEYNSWVPYISGAPIIAFVILRNFCRQARNVHSSMLAWIGQHSLETFTLQFHIWLAADTKGILRIGLLERASGGVFDDRKFDMVITTIIFLWTCWHVSAATHTLTSWLIDSRNTEPTIEAEGGPDGENNGLPLTSIRKGTIEMNLPKRSLDGVIRWAMMLSRTIMRLMRGHLEVRLILILGFMWLLNAVDQS